MELIERQLSASVRLVRPGAKKQDMKKATETKESLVLVESCFYLARSLSIKTLLVLADAVADIRVIDERQEAEDIIWLTRNLDDLKGSLGSGSKGGNYFLELPHSKMTPLGQVHIGLFLSVLKGYVELNQTVVCLTGVAGSSRLDMLLLANPQRDFPWFRRRLMEASENALQFIPAETFARILEIALRFATEGREGRPIGTIFVIGEPDKIKPHVRQLIHNPCRGHAKRIRSIHNPDYFETLRELAAIDGAFVVSRRGVVESAGVYLDAQVKRSRLTSGLGARHAAALAMSKAVECVTVVISESSGTVTMFHSGQKLLELESPKTAMAMDAQLSLPEAGSGEASSAG